VRGLLSIIAVMVSMATVAAGCGGDSSSGGALESSLAYVPKGTPFAVAIDTDLEGDQYRSLDAALGKFPGGDAIKDSLRQQLEEGTDGISFEDDLRPLLGNPFVVSATGVGSFLGSSERDDFVAALQVEDTDALDRLVEKTKPEEHGEVSGATVYEDDGTFFAVEDDVVVLAGSQQQLESALERADGSDHLDEDTFESSLEGLPEQALARVYVDLQALIDQDPDAATARKIEWIAALRTLGLTASVDDDSIDVEFNARTEGDDLGDEDLPLAAGDEAPGVVQLPGEIALGVRDPSQIVRFFETAFQAVDPSGFGDYQQGKQALAGQLDVDVDRELIDQLTGDLSISVAVDGAFSARAELEDAEAFGRTVDRLADALPELGSGLGVTDVSRRGDLYEASLDDGSRFVFGVTDGVLVVASELARAREIASQQPSEVDGARGSLVLGADAEQLAAHVIEQVGPGFGLPEGFPGGLFARPLDDLEGSMSSSTDGMKGKLSLTLD
jgi:hypothetical protein